MDPSKENLYNDARAKRLMCFTHLLMQHCSLYSFYLTIRLLARDFYCVIVDEADGQINYHA